jgi:hypothetical protein
MERKKNFLSQLVGVSAAEVSRKNARFVLLDGLEKAIEYYTDSLGGTDIESRELRGYLHHLTNDVELEELLSGDKFDLTPEEEGVFSKCGGGINRETSRQLDEFARKRLA